jgi:stage V sporulation protein AE
MNFLIAFLIGGLLCVVGQILIDKTMLTPARIMVGYVTLGVILGGIGVYNMFVEFAGAGATVPLLGFGNSLANGVKEGINEKGFVGIFTGALSATAGGIAAAIFFGYLSAILFRSKSK